MSTTSNVNGVEGNKHLNDGHSSDTESSSRKKSKPSNVANGSVDTPIIQINSCEEESNSCNSSDNEEVVEQPTLRRRARTVKMDPFNPEQHDASLLPVIFQKKAPDSSKTKSTEKSEANETENKSNTKESNRTSSSSSPNLSTRPTTAYNIRPLQIDDDDILVRPKSMTSTVKDKKKERRKSGLYFKTKNKDHLRRFSGNFKAIVKRKKTKDVGSDSPLHASSGSSNSSHSSNNSSSSSNSSSSNSSHSSSNSSSSNSSSSNKKAADRKLKKQQRLSAIGNSASEQRQVLSRLQQRGPLLHLESVMKFLQQLIAAEKKYIQNLDYIVEQYWVPIKKTKAKVKKKEIDAFFLNVDKIAGQHKSLLRELESQLRKFPLDDDLGGILIAQVPLLGEEYKIYARGYAVAKAKAQTLISGEAKPNWKALFKFCNEKQLKQLASLLELPLNRIKSISLAIKSLLSTQRSTEGYDVLLTASSMFSALSRFVSSVSELTHTKELLVHWESRFVYKAKDEPSIIKNGRRLVCHGALTVNDKKRAVFLFNDLCIITKQQGMNFKVLFKFSLEGSKMTSNDIQQADPKLQSFKVITSTKTIFIITEKKPNANEGSWLETFDDLLQQCNHSIFGCSLESLTNRENSPLPNVIAGCLFHLNKYADTPKLFREPPSIQAVSTLQQRVNQNDRNVDLSSCNPHDVASLLILYLRSLPGPVIPYQPRSPMFYSYGKKGIAAITQIVKDLPKANRNLLEYIAYFLSTVSKTSVKKLKTQSKEVNANEYSLNAQELAHIFGPVLIQPAEPTLEYCFQIPKVIRAFQCMIESAEQIFAAEETTKHSKKINVSLVTFLNTDQFHQWWRDFRSQQHYIGKFLRKDTTLLELFQFATYVEVPTRTGKEEKSKKIKLDNFKIGKPTKGNEITDEQEKYAALSLTILSSEMICNSLLEENKDFLEILLSFIDHKPKLCEKGIKNICDFLLALLKSHKQLFTSFILQSSNANAILVRNIGSYNVSKFLNSAMRQTTSIQNVAKLLKAWAMEILKILPSKNESFSEDFTSNAVHFLSELLQTQQPFVTSDKALATFFCSTALISSITQKAIQSDNLTSSLLFTLLECFVKHAIFFINDEERDATIPVNAKEKRQYVEDRSTLLLTSSQTFKSSPSLKNFLRKGRSKLEEFTSPRQSTSSSSSQNAQSQSQSQPLKRSRTPESNRSGSRSRDAHSVSPSLSRRANRNSMPINSNLLTASLDSHLQREKEENRKNNNYLSPMLAKVSPPPSSSPSLPRSKRKGKPRTSLLQTQDQNMQVEGSPLLKRMQKSSTRTPAVNSNSSNNTKNSWGDLDYASVSSPARFDPKSIVPLTEEELEKIWEASVWKSHITTLEDDSTTNSAGGDVESDCDDMNVIAFNDEIDESTLFVAPLSHRATMPTEIEVTDIIEIEDNTTQETKTTITATDNEEANTSNELDTINISEEDFIATIEKEMALLQSTTAEEQQLPSSDVQLMQFSFDFEPSLEVDEEGEYLRFDSDDEDNNEKDIWWLSESKEKEKFQITRTASSNDDDDNNNTNSSSSNNKKVNLSLNTKSAQGSQAANTKSSSKSTKKLTQQKQRQTEEATITTKTQNSTTTTTAKTPTTITTTTTTTTKIPTHNNNNSSSSNNNSNKVVVAKLILEESPRRNTPGDIKSPRRRREENEANFVLHRSDSSSSSTKITPPTTPGTKHQPPISTVIFNNSKFIISILQEPLKQVENESEIIEKELKDINEETLFADNFDILQDEEDVESLLDEDENESVDEKKQSYIDALVLQKLLQLRKIPLLTMRRVTIIKLITSLISNARESKTKEIMESTILVSCFDLFFTYVNHNVLHSSILEMFQAIISSNQLPMIKYLIETIEFPSRALKLYAINTQLRRAKNKTVRTPLPIISYLNVCLKSLANYQFALDICKKKAYYSKLKCRMEAISNI